MRSRLLPLFLLLFTASLLTAQATYKLNPRNPAEVAAAQRRAVGLYCRLDFDGGRFNEEGWQKIRPLMQDRQNPDFRVIEIVSRYHIAPPSEGPSSPYVNVTYTLMGRFDSSYGYSADTSLRQVMFRAENKGGEVLISSIEPNVPRVSKRAAVEWLKRRLDSVQDPVEKGYIAKALAVLEPPTTPAGTPAAKTDAAAPGESK